MTCFDPDPARSTFDLPLEVATARMVALQRETDRTRSAERHSGPVHGIRTRDRTRAHRPRVGDRALRDADGDVAPADRRQPLTPPSSTGTPPLRTSVGRRRTSTSTSGSASTATRSANRPGVSEPTRSSQPISSAAVRVAERIAAGGVCPRRTW